MALRSIRAEGAYFAWNGGAEVLLRSQQGEVAKDVQRRAHAVAKRMKRKAGYRYGTLRKGIRSESIQRAEKGPLAYVVSTAEHTMVHERGRKALVPVRARALRFQPKRGMSFIYRARVGPADANPFMESSLDAVVD